MKIRIDHVTNSSSDYFAVTNKSRKVLDMVDLVNEIFYIIEREGLAGKLNYSKSAKDYLLNEAQKEHQTFMPGKEEIISCPEGDTFSELFWFLSDNKIKLLSFSAYLGRAEG